MSRWTHATCLACWAKRYGGRPAHAMVTPDQESCCYCGETTTSGIYQRDDPATVPCGGRHEEATTSA